MNNKNITLDELNNQQRVRKENEIFKQALITHYKEKYKLDDTVKLVNTNNTSFSEHTLECIVSFAIKDNQDINILFATLNQFTNTEHQISIDRILVALEKTHIPIEVRYRLIKTLILNRVSKPEENVK